MTLHDREILARHLSRVPVHRALIRALENRLFDRELLVHPVLDIGCGDGHFAAVVFSGGIDLGMDVSTAAVAEARRNGPYRHLLIASGTALPCHGGMFHTVVSNCAIEHVADSEALVGEVARVLAPGGKFIFSVMNDKFTDMLFVVRTLRRIGMRKLAGAYGRWWNRRAVHCCLESPEEWRERLARHNLTVVSHTYYLSLDATRVFELAHYYYALPALLCRGLAGRWNWGKLPVQSRPAFGRLQPYAEEPWPADGAASFFVACKGNPLLPAAAGGAGRDQ